MDTKIRYCILAIIAPAVFSISTNCQIRLPRLIGNGMVLQRETKTKIWGWAGPGEQIQVGFLDSVYHTKADSMGNWQVVLEGLKAGGPYSMKIYAGDTVNLSDIMIGDVWLCSGQSNMELPMRRVSPIYGDEIKNSENPDIRYFAVPQKYDFNRPETDLQWGVWKAANPENILNFSAVAYFYAKALNDRYKVPIGLINASLGGSPLEAWLSEDGLKKFPSYYSEAMKFRDSSLIEKIESDDRARIGAWYSLLYEKDEGYKNPTRPWYSEKIKGLAKWNKIKVPGYWSGTGLEGVKGVVWFRKEFVVPASMTGIPVKLNLGRIVDADSVFINGKFTGTTGYQYPPRRYMIPAGMLRKGKNILVVRIICESGDGGFVPDKPYELIGGGNRVDLRGEWKYRLGAAMEPLAGQTFIRWKPLGLYNAMINPLIKYGIKGAVWYQGESNTWNPLEYRELLPALIRDWRVKWNQGDFPFLYVQLPNFMETKKEPGESNWALLREAQLMTLSVPNTAMAVAIDLGEWNDIHPLNKKDVGVRLALAARKIAYGEKDAVGSGPVYESMATDGNRIILKFRDVGNGLMVKGGGELHYFAIAGRDRKFVWAKAVIAGDSVIVWNDGIADPAAVRYAWADNPEGANLYNKEGLPASPFRTDDWPAVQ